MAWFRRRKGPFAHEMDRFHIEREVRRSPAMPRLVTGTSPAASEGRRRSDLTVAALGITLALICALFPWYIFFNQDQFGVRAMKFQGGADAELDIAVRQVPLIYEALTQSPKDRASNDAFSDLARHLKGKQSVDAGD